MALLTSERYCVLPPEPSLLHYHSRAPLISRTSARVHIAQRAEHYHITVLHVSAAMDYWIS